MGRMILGRTNWGMGYNTDKYRTNSSKIRYKIGIYIPWLLKRKYKDHRLQTDFVILKTIN